MQGDLFDEEPPQGPTALQTWYLTPPCAHGCRSFNTSPVFAVGWPGPHHCYECFVAVEEGCRAFRAAVRRGEYNEYGFTPAEWRALLKRTPDYRPRVRLVGPETDR